MGRPSQSHEEFAAKVFAVHGSNFLIVGKYINARTPIKYKYIPCGHSGKINSPSSIFTLKGCPECNKSWNRCSALNSLKEYRAALYKRFEGSIVLSDRSIKYPIEHQNFRCTSCDSTFKAELGNMLKRKYGCGNCAHTVRRKLPAQYKKELHKLLPSVIA